MMHRRVVVLGGGTGGTLAANRLRQELPRDTTITVVDENNGHVYQPGLLFVPFGMTRPTDIVRSRPDQLRGDIDYRCAAIDRVDLERDEVHVGTGDVIPYDVLVVATGARLVPEETEGLADAMDAGIAYTFYELESAAALAGRLATFERGRLVVNVVDLPIKCPVAPLEFCFLADWFFQRRGVRNNIDITYVTPLDGAFTKPTASHRLEGMLDARGIELVTEFNTGEVDVIGRRLVAYDDRDVGFDLAVVVPLHNGAAYVGRSAGLGDELDFVPADEHTLQARTKGNVFAIGDATALPVSKAGSVTHFEGATLVENVQRFLQDRPLAATYDGHVNCFVETGSHKAMLIDFNYDQEPVGGHYPSRVGLPLLQESRLNHVGKRMFEWFYWNMLLPGRDVPGITSTMPVGGKDIVSPAAERTAV
jgi:sulfide:quinone oxidoreductase